MYLQIVEEELGHAPSDKMISAIQGQEQSLVSIDASLSDICLNNESSL